LLLLQVKVDQKHIKPAMRGLEAIFSVYFLCLSPLITFGTSGMVEHLWARALKSQSKPDYSTTQDVWTMPP